MRILVATAVPLELDAVAHAFGSTTADSPDTTVLAELTLPGATLLSPSAPSASAAARARPPRAPGGPGHDASRPSPVPATTVPEGSVPARWDLLAAGVGPARAAAGAAAALTAAALSGEQYGLVVCAGIGGGFLPAAPPGSLVIANKIVAADLGAETAEGFVPVTDLGFGTVAHRPPAALVRHAAAVTSAVTGTVLTVSTVTGSAARAAELRERYPQALAEGMEGFGVAEAAAVQGVPVLEVRGISNPVGPRDRSAWRIGEACAALTEAFRRLKPELERWHP